MPLDDSSAVFCVFPKEKVLPFPISYILCYEKTEWLFIFLYENEYYSIKMIKFANTNPIFNYHHDGNKQETIFQ